MKYLLICCWLGIVLSAKGQFVQTCGGYASLGAYSSVPTHALSFTANQGALASIKQGSAAVYAERRFLVSELSFYHLAVALPAGSGNFGLQAASFGSTASSQTKLGLAYARTLSSKVALGAQFNYFRYAIAGYGSAGAVNIEGGLLLNVTEQLRLGLHIYNPTHTGFINSKEKKLPAAYTTGIGYQASGQLFVSAEICKTENEPLDFRAGLQYQPIEKLVVKGGVTTATSTFYGGAGVVLKPIVVHAVASFHPQLGITPGLMVTYSTDRQ